jgi:hypothetical protein
MMLAKRWNPQSSKPSVTSGAKALEVTFLSARAPFCFGNARRPLLCGKAGPHGSAASVLGTQGPCAKLWAR